MVSHVQNGMLLRKAVNYHQAGDQENALSIYQKLMKSWPDNPDVWHLAGQVEFSKGKHELAIFYIKRALALKIDPLFLNTLGVVFASLNDFDNAEKSYQQAISLKQNYAEAIYNLGNNYKKKGDFHRAINCFQYAVEIKNNYIDALFNLANTYREIGRHKEAVDIYSQIVRLDKSNISVRLNLGKTLEILRKHDKAEREYREILSIEPDHYMAMANLALLLERSNRVQSAEEITKIGLEKFPDSPEFNLSMAMIERRRGNYTVAKSRLSNLQLDKARKLVAASVYFELGRIEDKTNHYDAAFENFRKGNEYYIEIFRDDHRLFKDYYISEMDKLEKFLVSGAMDLYSQKLAGRADKQLIFVVGFPRSGTTLLDTILSAHPEIKTYEEKAAIQRVSGRLHNMGSGYPSVLAELTAQEIFSLRKIYFSYLANGDGIRENIVIDRDPFNMWQLPVVHTIFPEAKIIFIVRHPIDVCLSCFMQDFQMNVGTAHFYCLEDIGYLYERFLRLYRQSIERLNIQNYCLKYEDLIEDMPTSVRSVLEFIGVKWHDKINDYLAAAARKKITTASYHQAIKPIYKDAKDRWKRYGKHLDILKNKLKDSIEYLGYHQ